MIHVYLREQPRALILLSSTASEKERTALLLSARVRKGTNTSDAGTRAVIQSLSENEIPDLSTLRTLHSSSFGCLGLINVGNDLFVGIVERTAQVGEIRPGEMVLRITSVAFHCLNKELWDDSAYGTYAGSAPDGQRFTAANYDAGSANAMLEHPCTSMRKLLANGTFYIAQDASFDISRRLDARMHAGARNKSNSDEKLISPAMENPPPLNLLPEEGDVASSSTFDQRFIWNTYMMEPLHEYRNRLDSSELRALDRNKFLLLVIQGYVGVSKVGTDSTIALVSRLSWKRAGTRYATRGIDDDGNVANFAESETLYTYEGRTMSYCQVRGSVPLFWEQQGLQTFNARIQLTRSRIASQPAFDRHFADLLSQYGHVQALNLLGTRDAETVLTQAYAEHMRSSEAEEMYLASLSKQDGITQAEQDALERVGLTNFDFHSVTRLHGGLDSVKGELMRLGPVLRKEEAFQFSLIDRDDKCLKRQLGVFRVNCLDCLDRTNVVQDILSQGALQLCVRQASRGDGLPDAGNALWAQHRTIWAENGDALSRIYAGTGALNSNFTRTGVGKKTLGGLLSDAAKSASRLYINNFQDKSKQSVIDALLGNVANQQPVSVFDPIHDAVNAELDERLDEFSTIKKISVFTGTWNLAGRGPGGEGLEPFLFPDLSADVEPDVLVIGLQEVVPLTPQQILLTDPEKLRLWERTISQAVTRRSERKKGGAARYIPLRSEQLVGTALIVLIKETLLPHVRQVEAATKKTGLKGMSGNKGGVAIRMNIFDTNFCFVTAHFAAGKSNVEERNADFMTISRELHFHSGRDIHSAHHAFWLGDFNYRIDGTNETVRTLCEHGDLDELIQNDQLVRATNAGQVFRGYSEGLLVFLPTYKYDFHSQRYDTSEKMRVPAWTDRILYKSRRPFKAQLIAYDRAELFTSDHRPVFAVFHADARQYDTEKRNALRRELLGKYKSIQSRGRSTTDLLGEALFTSEDEGISSPYDDADDGYATDELPNPSSATDSSSWWDEALSSEDDSQDEEHSDSSNEERRVDANPFLRHRRRRAPAEAQYACYRSRESSTRSGPTSSSAHSPLGKKSVSAPGSGGVAIVPQPRSAPSTASPVRKVDVTRRPPPEPPSKSSATIMPSFTLSPSTSLDKDALSSALSSAPPSTTASTVTPQHSTSGRQSGPPPIVPSKPAQLTNRQMSDGQVKTEDEKKDEGARETASKLTTQKFPPLIPARPGLGPRSQSYQSTKSQRSLLDDSD